MITLIVGKKGTGKTKILVDMVAKAEAASSGNVVCIERVPNLTYSIPPSVRLMETSKDEIEGYEEFYGTDMFVDSTLRIGGRDYDKLGKFLQKLNKSVGDRDVNIVFTVSADREELPESVTAFIK